MSVRPPKQFSARVVDPIQAALEAEVLEEKAHTLARMARRLEKALADLAVFEGKGRGEAPDPSPPSPTAKAMAAGTRVWQALVRTSEVEPRPLRQRVKREQAAGRRVDRERLIAEAAEALWFLIIQRELLGLGGEERVCRDYRVPAAVRARLGVRPTRP